MSLEQIADLVVGLLVLAVSAIASILWKHGNKITHLEATVVPDETIRRIMEREVDRLHDDFKSLREEQREDMQSLDAKIEQIRNALGTRANDKT